MNGKISDNIHNIIIITNKTNAFLIVGVYSYTIFGFAVDVEVDDVDEKKSNGDVIKHGM
jgi:hypothetical protein